MALSAGMAERRRIEQELQQQKSVVEAIDDLLDFTRIARDKMQLRFAPIDAHQAVSNVVEICRAEARSKKLSVHLNLRAKSCQVTADAAKFQQIIWNLLKNAIKFTPEGGDITMFSDNPSEGVFTVSVRDTGIGMEPEVMQRIFDPFEQGNRSFEHRFGGLGLGLGHFKISRAGPRRHADCTKRRIQSWLNFYVVDASSPAR